MKFCPTCQTRYDEEILRFCTKDGTPLVDENPSFTAMPSESSVEINGEETIIRRNPPPSVSPISEPMQPSAQRIVIPTSEIRKEPVRAPSHARYQQPSRKSNTALVMLLTIFGTLAILAGAGGVWYFLRNENVANTNSNQTTNINTNLGANNSNFNINFNADNSLLNSNTDVNFNSNTNTNANLKTPTPTPKPSPSVTPQRTNININSNVNGNTNVNTRPIGTPTPTPSPTAPPQNVNVGVMNSRATSLPKPAYPQAAKQANASGPVMVQVSVDENGNVTSARAISGHPLLRASAENAARQSRFNPVKVGDKTVRATGVLVYNFINQ